MSHSHQSIRTLWESTAITLWAKLLSGEIPLKASHKRLLWPSVVSSSFLQFLCFLSSCIFFLAFFLDFSCCFAFLLALSLSFFHSFSSFLYLFLCSFLPFFLDPQCNRNKGLNQIPGIDLRV